MDIADILKQLNSPADVAIVLGAGVIGFTTDAVINFAPIPVFSPGVCGLTAMSGALAAKRAVDARIQATHKRRKFELARKRAEALVMALHASGRHRQAAEQLEYEIERATVDLDQPALDEAISIAAGLLH